MTDHPITPPHKRFPMPDRSLAIALAVSLSILSVALWATFHTAVQCHAVGGTTVRGLFWLECIR